MHGFAGFIIRSCSLCHCIYSVPWEENHISHNDGDKFSGDPFLGAVKYIYRVDLTEYSNYIWYFPVQAEYDADTG